MFNSSWREAIISSCLKLHRFSQIYVEKIKLLYMSKLSDKKFTFDWLRRRVTRNAQIQELKTIWCNSYQTRPVRKEMLVWFKLLVYHQGMWSFFCFHSKLLGQSFISLHYPLFIITLYLANLYKGAIHSFYVKKRHKSILGRKFANGKATVALHQTIYVQSILSFLENQQTKGNLRVSPRIFL